MDDRGYWHERKDSEVQKMLDELNGEVRSAFPGRPVIEIGIGEMVSITKADAQQVMATFDAAEKNKVTLTPQDNGQPLPYLELAERVTLARANGDSIQAQVWDNRRGKIILRTLPL